MATTDADTFGAAVVTDMGALDAFTTTPLLKPALRLAAARTYQGYLVGELSAAAADAAAVTAATFAEKCLEAADGRYLGADPMFANLWPASDTRTAFAASCAAVFPTYDN